MNGGRVVRDAADAAAVRKLLEAELLAEEVADLGLGRVAGDELAVAAAC